MFACRTLKPRAKRLTASIENGNLIMVGLEGDMEMTGYTKGPWVSSVDESGCNLTVKAGDVDIVGGCGCCGSPWTDEESAKANASLIAAAPDLLEALKEVLAAEDDALHVDGNSFLGGSFLPRYRMQ